MRHRLGIDLHLDWVKKQKRKCRTQSTGTKSNRDQLTWITSHGSVDGNGSNLFLCSLDILNLQIFCNSPLSTWLDSKSASQTLNSKSSTHCKKCDSVFAVWNCFARSLRSSFMLFISRLSFVFVRRKNSSRDCAVLLFMSKSTKARQRQSKNETKIKIKMNISLSNPKRRRDFATFRVCEALHSIRCCVWVCACRAHISEHMKYRFVSWSLFDHRVHRGDCRPKVLQSAQMKRTRALTCRTSYKGRHCEDYVLVWLRSFQRLLHI